MALVLNEEQSMLRDSARGLISDKAPVSHLRQLRDAKDATGFSRELWKAFAEMGFSGLLVPEAFGGSGLGCVEAGIVMEEIGRTLMPSPYLATAVLGGVGAVARRQRRAEVAVSAENIGWFAAGRARDRRRCKTSPADDKTAGGAFRQRFQALGRQGLRGRRPHRRSPDRGGAQRGLRRRARRADAVPGRSQNQGRRDRAHRDGRCAQCRANRVRQCRGQRRRRARRGRSGFCACWKACSISAAPRWPPKWSG